MACVFWGFNLLTGGESLALEGPFAPYGHWANHSESLTPAEALLVLGLKVFGAFAWSVIFGQLVVSLTHGADPAEIAFGQSLGLLNSFVKEGENSCCLRPPPRTAASSRRLEPPPRTTASNRRLRTAASEPPPPNRRLEPPPPTPPRHASLAPDRHHHPAPHAPTPHRASAELAGA